MKTRMKVVKLALAASVGLLPGVSAQAGYTIDLGFSAVPGSSITFNGASDSFTIAPSALTTGKFAADNGEQFQITTELAGGTTGPGILGYFGAPAGVTVGYTAPVQGPAGVWTSTVNNPASSPLLLVDKNGKTLTGTLTWGSLVTWTVANGALNASLAENVSFPAGSYTGSNSELSQLQAIGHANLQLVWAFAPGMTLAQLSSGGGPYTTTYAGEIVSTVPEAGTAAAGGVGLGLAVLLMALQSGRKTSVKLN